MKSLTGQFADWVALKPADEEYDYCSNDNCAFAQFLIANGYAREPMVGPLGWRDNSADNRIEHDLPARIERALSKYNCGLPNGGRTFGALAERLAAEVSA